MSESRKAVLDSSLIGGQRVTVQVNKWNVVADGEELTRPPDEVTETFVIYTDAQGNEVTDPAQIALLDEHHERQALGDEEESASDA